MAFVALLPHRAVIRVEGPDARSFLNGLLTQEAEGLAPGVLRYGALLTPQGRLVCDLFLRGEAEGVLIDVDRTVTDALLAKLKMHRLRAKCEIAASETAVATAWGEEPGGEEPGGEEPEGEEPEGEGWIADPRLPAAGWRGYDLDVSETADEDAYDAHRFALGLPDAVRDGLADKAYATEADLDLLNGVDFHKGCYVGQETTSRMWRRGGIRSRVLPLEVEGASAGEEVLAGDLRAGVVMAARHDRALALVRLDRVAGRSLSIGGRPARLDPPAWLPASAIEETTA